MKYSRAFTLIELIMVILIISVLAVTIVPKFFTSSEVEHFAVRDQLISQLRLSQLKAMNQIDVCNRVKITDEYAVVENNSGTACGTEGNSDTRVILENASVKLSSGTTPNPFYITFNSDGISDCDCTLNIIGSETVQIKIESQGYIHAL
ncbi:MAG: type II secretion system protein [Psychrobium sp.]